MCNITYYTCIYIHTPITILAPPPARSLPLAALSRSWRPCWAIVVKGSTWRVAERGVAAEKVIKGLLRQPSL